MRRYDGAGGRSSCHSLGQAFQTSSFTLPTVVSGSKLIVRLLPDTSKNVNEVCGICGTASGPISAASGGGAIALDTCESSGCSVPSCEGGAGTSASRSTYVAAVYGLDAGIPKLGAGNSIVGLSSVVE
jgi:hypothetical protein